METCDPALAKDGFASADAVSHLPPAVASRRPGSSSAAAWRAGLNAELAGRLATIAVVVLAYLLSQGDQGLQGDAHIYMGRAMADLDPRGIGRDLMFAHDGQSPFSVFGLVARYSVRAFGLAATERGLHSAAAIVWGTAMLVLVSALRPGRGFAVVAAAALLLPRWYTPWHGLGAGEAMAVPRPFAEAAVLLALALQMRGRRLSCVLLLCVAAALHPIMAAPGFGVLLIDLAVRDRRWALGGAALATALLIGAGLGTPLLARLAVTIDPAFLSILRERSPYLFVSAWPAASFGLVLLQLATILVASTLVPDAFSRLLRSVAAVALLGCLASAICCDGLRLLLFAQAQLWRSLWLAAAFAPLAAGVCLWRLPGLGDRGRLTLACLVSAWTCCELQPTSAVLAVIATALLGRRGVELGAASRLAVIAAAGAATVLSVLLDIRLASGNRFGEFPFVWHLTIWPVVIVGFALFGARQPGRSFASIAAFLVLPTLLVTLAFRYDERSRRKADLDAGGLEPDLMALLASRPGEVLWLGGDELWYWTRRPNWSASLQGAGIVFSRELALLWHDRAKALVDHGLATPNYLRPWAQGTVRPLTYDRSRIEDLCRRPDAPAWVVLPASGTSPLAIDADVRTWTLPREDPPRRDDDSAARSTSMRLVVPCRRT